MTTRTTTIHPLARKLLRDTEFCRDVDRRVQASAELVERLPRTAHDIDLLLARTPHRLSHEVQFAVLNTLDSIEISSAHVKRLLPCVLDRLANVNSRVASVFMVIGCLLGDSFLRSADRTTRRRIMAELIHAVRSASSVHARYGALHGIEHALNNASLKEGMRLLHTVREV